MMMGAALAAGGDGSAAGAHLRSAARLAAGNAAAFVRLGAVFLHLDQPVEAARHYAAALAIDPVAPDALAGAGLAMLALGDVDGAEARLRASLGQRYHAPALHHQLGLLFASRGRWVEAADALRTALAQHPGLAGAEELLQRVLTKLET
jgi:tetratricopeptide (TPR) repeat protein